MHPRKGTTCIAKLLLLNMEFYDIMFASTFQNASLHSFAVSSPVLIIATLAIMMLTRMIMETNLTMNLLRM
jgi:hypothetical protein